MPVSTSGTLFWCALVFGAVAGWVLGIAGPSSLPVEEVPHFFPRSNPVSSQALLHSRSMTATLQDVAQSSCLLRKCSLSAASQGLPLERFGQPGLVQQHTNLWNVTHMLRSALCNCIWTRLAIPYLCIPVRRLTLHCHGNAGPRLASGGADGLFQVSCTAESASTETSSQASAFAASLPYGDIHKGSWQPLNIVTNQCPSKLADARQAWCALLAR